MDHLAAADVDAAVIRVDGNVARLRVADVLPAQERVSGAQTAVRAGQAVGHEAGAVERARGARAPDVLGVADVAVRAVDDRVAGHGVVSGLGVGRRGRGARAAAGVSAATLLVLDGGLLRLLHDLLGRSGLGGSLGGALLLEELGGLGGQAVIGRLHLADGGLGLVLDLLGLGGLLSSNLLLGGVLGLLVLDLLTQVLGLVDELGIALVHLVEQIPVVHELGERRGPEQHVDDRSAAVAVHRLGTIAQALLKAGDLLVRLVDALLRLVHLLLRLLLLVKRGVVIVGSLIQLSLHGVEGCENRLGLRLLLGGRRIRVSLGRHGDRHHDAHGEHGGKGRRSRDAEGISLRINHVIASSLSAFPRTSAPVSRKAVL